MFTAEMTCFKHKVAPNERSNDLIGMTGIGVYPSSSFPKVHSIGIVGKQVRLTSVSRWICIYLIEGCANQRDNKLEYGSELGAHFKRPVYNKV